MITRRDELASKAQKKEAEPRGRGRGRSGRGGRGRGRGAASTPKNEKNDKEQEDESESEEPPKKARRKIQPEATSHKMEKTEISKPSGSKDVPTKRLKGKTPPKQVIDEDVTKKHAKKADAFMTAEPINYTNQKIGEIREFVEYIYDPKMAFDDLKAQTKEYLRSYGLTYTRLTIYWTRSQCGLQVQDDSSEKFRASHFFSYPKEDGNDHLRLLVTIAAGVSLVPGRYSSNFLFSPLATGNQFLQISLNSIRSPIPPHLVQGPFHRKVAVVCRLNTSYAPPQKHHRHHHHQNTSFQRPPHTK